MHLCFRHIEAAGPGVNSNHAHLRRANCSHLLCKVYITSQCGEAQNSDIYDHESGLELTCSDDNYVILYKAFCLQCSLIVTCYISTGTLRFKKHKFQHNCEQDIKIRETS